MNKLKELKNHMRQIRVSQLDVVPTIRYYDSVTGVMRGDVTLSADFPKEVRSCASPLFLSRAIKRDIKKISCSEKS